MIDFVKHFSYQFAVKATKLNFKETLILLRITKIDVEEVANITDLLQYVQNGFILDNFLNIDFCLFFVTVSNKRTFNGF